MVYKYICGKNNMYCTMGYYCRVGESIKLNIKNVSYKECICCNEGIYVQGLYNCYSL